MEDRVLIVDDDEAVLTMLEKVMRSYGFLPDTVMTGEEAIERIMNIGYALVLLDINLKGINGFQVIERIRKNGQNLPIIVISARKEEYDTLYGLDIGADDYITKPFNPVILGAKAKALVRRSKAPSGTCGEIMTVGPFSYNLSTLRFYKGGAEIELTGRENAIMKLFLDNAGRVFSREMIFDLIWADPSADSSAVPVYINRLRQKIEDDPAAPAFIQNIRGIGYRFVIPEKP